MFMALRSQMEGDDCNNMNTMLASISLYKALSDPRMQTLSARM